MTDIKIDITPYYLRDGKFLMFRFSSYIEGGYCYIGNAETLSIAASKILYDASRYNITDPVYTVTQWEGPSPLKDCKDKCRHALHTQEPAESVKEDLMRLLLA